MQAQQMVGNPTSLSDRVALMVSEAAKGTFTKTEILDRVYCKAGMTTSQDLSKVCFH